MAQLIDSCNRKVDYLRVSITDRCNLRCKYCMPQAGIKNVSHNDILRYEQLEQIIGVAAQLGIKKVRLTGGDPLVRKGVSDLVAMIKGLSGIEEVSMTTNGVLLSDYAKRLSQAGLDRVNISLDTLNAKKYQKITGSDSLATVKEGIKAAFKYNFKPVKINVVVLKGFNDDEIFDFLQLTEEYPVHVRFIELMSFNDDFKSGYLGTDQLRQLISERIKLKKATLKVGNGPARYFTFAGCKGSVGFISPLSNHFCGQCNRLRLTAAGKLRACLCSKEEIDLKQVVKVGDITAIKEKFMIAINNKPDSHQLKQASGNDALSSMAQIGG